MNVTKRKEYDRSNRIYSIKSGEKFGYLEVLCYTDRPNIKGEYKCKCVCGNITYKRTYSLKKFKGISCGCKNGENVANAHILPNDLGLYNELYYNYKAGAKRRGHSFELNFEDFKYFVDANCFYCGIHPLKSIYSHAQKRKVIHSDRKVNGVDRRDNNQGYIKSNCVTACYICNNAKNILSEQEFLDWIQRVNSFQIQKRSTTIRKEYTQVGGNGNLPNKEEDIV